MDAVVTRRALTTKAIALTLRKPIATVEALLDDEMMRGNVERLPSGHWRITTSAEQAHGEALRDLWREQ